MSDLIEKLRDPNVVYMTREAAAEVADALEAMQKENERLTRYIESPKHYEADNRKRIAELESGLRQIARECAGTWAAALAWQALKENHDA